jgi:membrane fusion protein (multidrug efflux system)
MFDQQVMRLGVAVVALCIASCSEPPPPPAPPPVEVAVITITPQDAANLVALPGRVQAVRTAEVRARVDGVVQRLLYTEGTDVTKGQELFIIDPRDMEASVGASRAALARAQTTAANASQDVKRYVGLVEQGVISRQQYDAAVAKQRTAQSDVDQARAQLQRAQLNLSYATVTAPIAGRAGRAQVTVGALVSAAAGTLLTTIEPLDPINVNFSQTSAEMQKARRDIADGTLKVPKLDHVVVTLQLEDGSIYSLPGHINFLDLSLNRDTGSAALRAEFPNPKRSLLPGQFVRVRIEAGERPNSIVVPQRAVTLRGEGAIVMVVDDAGVVAERSITLGEQSAGSWRVLTGLNAGDRVVVDGLQKIRPGQKVKVAGDTAPQKAASSAPSAK